MQSTFGFSGASAPFYINPVIRVDLTTVENIKDYIDDIVISEEVGVSKPDPKIFDIAMDVTTGNPTVPH